MTRVARNELAASSRVTRTGRSEVSKRLVLLMCFAVLGGGAFLAACGGDDDGGTGGGEHRRRPRAPRRSTSATMETAKGNVTVCMGKDTGGDVTAAIKAFNAQKNGVTAKILEFSTSADEQRQQFVQRQEAKSGECDVFSSDVIWTAEFASQKWLYDLTPYIDTRRDELIEATLETATFDGKVWGMPQQTDAGFLYYRTDQVKTSRRPGRRSTRTPRRRTASSTRARRTRA